MHSPEAQKEDYSINTYVPLSEILGDLLKLRSPSLGPKTLSFIRRNRSLNLLQGAGEGHVQRRAKRSGA